MTNFRLFKNERVHTTILKLREMVESLPEIVESTVGKGEIACCERFLLFSTVFSKVLYCRHVETSACLGKVACDSSNGISL